MSAEYGPKVTVSRKCYECPACVTEHYTAQGDSGRDVYCTHPAFQDETNGRRFIGDTTWTTPEWCPARAELEAAPAPVVGAPTDEEIDGIFFEHCCTDDFNNEVMELQEFREGARAVLARFGVTAPAPVPVAERLPDHRPESEGGDCDANWRCWLGMPDHGTDPSWTLTSPRNLNRYHSHWRPASAIPLPEVAP